MRWLVALLIAANLILALTVYVAGRRASPDAQLVNLEMNADKVQLVKSSRAPERSPAPKPDAARTAANAVCMEWGNFSAAELERARAKVAGLAPAVKLTVRELADTPAWWVYVPPLKSREEAEQTVAQLKGLGVTDMQVVTDSDRWRHAVSLGIFRNEEAAGAHLARMKELKVKGAVIGQRNNLVRLSALVIAEPSEAVVAAVTQLKPEFAGTDLKAIPCPGARP